MADASPSLPSTLEDRLAALCAEVLEVDSVGVHDDFFDLGGDSLLAAMVVNRVLDEFGVDLPIDAIFEEPTVAAMATCVREEIGAGGGEFEPRSVGRGARPVLAPMQRAIWTHGQLFRGTPVDHTRWALRLRGRLDVPALTKSFEAIVQRHDVLRSRFPARSGRPSIEVAESAEVPLSIDDLSSLDADARQSELERIAAENAQEPFDLATGPLLRARLVRTGDAESMLLLCVHHIVFDGWSMSVFVRELAAFYGSFCTGAPATLPALEHQFADAARFSNDALESGALASQIDVWRQRLGDTPARLTLPTDHRPPGGPDWDGRTIRISIPARHARSLRALCRDQDATLFAGLLAAFDALLLDVSGCEDVVVGSFHSGRKRLEFEPLIGPFLNTIVLRTDLSGDPTFRELVARCRATVQEANANADVPLEVLVKSLNPPVRIGRSPFFDVLFQLRSFPRASAETEGLSIIEDFVESGIARFDLFAEAYEDGDAIALRFEYRTALFDDATVRGWTDRFLSLIAAAVAAPERRLSELSRARLAQ